MPLKRHEHWDTRHLNDHLLAQHHAPSPYRWGVHDCALAAADAIQSFTGVDLAADFRGKYTSEAEAFALIHTLTGGHTLEDAIAWTAQKHGLVEWIRNAQPAPLFAQRGDLVLLEHDGGQQSAGVVHLRGTHVATAGESGLKMLSIRAIKRAWKI